jgi:hypothetical protein
MPRYSATAHDLPNGSRVFLNGEDVTDCASECDTDEGWAMVYAHERDATGKVTRLLDAEDGWNPVPRKRHGEVVVAMRKAP